MKNSLLSTLIICGSIATTIIAPITPVSSQPTSNSELRVYCGQALDPSSKRTLPATVASVGEGQEPITLIIWKSEAFPGFSPQNRCEIVSPKFQTALQQGRAYINSGQSKGTGIICAVATDSEACDDSKMLFTLKSYQDAESTIAEITNIFRGTINEPRYQNGGSKGVVNLRDLLKISRNK